VDGILRAGDLMPRADVADRWRGLGSTENVVNDLFLIIPEHPDGRRPPERDARNGFVPVEASIACVLGATALADLAGQSARACRDRSARHPEQVPGEWRPYAGKRPLST
jgi:hypothetical protein